MKYRFPIDRWKNLQYYTVLLNRRYLFDHWDYDDENLCFIEISDSEEYCSGYDQCEEPKPVLL